MPLRTSLAVWRSNTCVCVVGTWLAHENDKNRPNRSLLLEVQSCSSLQSVEHGDSSVEGLEFKYYIIHTWRRSSSPLQSSWSTSLQCFSRCLTQVRIFRLSFLLLSGPFFLHRTQVACSTPTWSRFFGRLPKWPGENVCSYQVHTYLNICLPLSGCLVLTLISTIDVEHYTPFTTMPLEIIVEIMNQLDWHSLLNIRQVSLCRLLFLLQGSSCCCSDMQFS